MLLLARQIMRSWLFIKLILTTESYFLDHLRQSRKKDGNFSCLLWISPNKHLSQLELKSARIKTNWKVPSSSKNYQHVIFMHESLPLSFFLVLPVCFWHGLVDKVSLVVEFQLWWVLKKAKNLHTLRKPFYFAKCQNHRKQFMLKTFFSHFLFLSTLFSEIMHNFWRSDIHWVHTLIFGQKSCSLGPTISEIPQTNWHYYWHAYMPSVNFWTPK